MPTKEEGVLALEKHLDEELTRLRERIRADNNEHFARAFDELRTTINSANENAKRIYEHELKHIEQMRMKHVGSRLETMALASYQQALEFNQKLLSNFVRDCTPPA